MARPIPSGEPAPVTSATRPSSLKGPDASAAGEVMAGYDARLSLVRRRDLQARILALPGGDPFAHVIAAANDHRRKHGRDCGLYPAGPHVMRLAATLARLS